MTNCAVAELFRDDECYEQISRFYADRQAKRSGVPLINHINEGLVILEAIEASSNAMKAYCLHPIFQDDDSFREIVYGERSSECLYGFDHCSEIVILATEYRAVANACLSDRQIENADEIRLSPLVDVNHMLIADKVQNRKDFERYHKDTHPRSLELDRYFKVWLERLGISDERYRELLSLIEP